MKRVNLYPLTEHAQNLSECESSCAGIYASVLDGGKKGVNEFDEGWGGGGGEEEESEKSS